jgi:integrase
MFAGWVPREENPLNLVHVIGSSKRKKRPRSLTIDEFRKFVDEPDDFSLSE